MDYSRHRVPGAWLYPVPGTAIEKIDLATYFAVYDTWEAPVALTRLRGPTKKYFFVGCWLTEYPLYEQKLL